MLPVDLPPAPQQAEYALLQDARAIHDSTSLRFSDFRENERPAWVVVTLSPGTNSGSATIPGAFIRSETGELVSPPGVQMVLVKEGSWKTLAFEAVNWPSEGTYHWHEPLDQPKRHLDREDVYSPFVSGGTILFRPAPDATGLKQFGQVHLIFADWVRFVGPAFLLAQTERVLQLEPAEPADKLTLLRLVSSENPFVAIVAFREFAAAGSITASIAREQLNRAQGPLRAAFTYILLTKPSADSVESLTSALAASVDSAQDKEALSPIALGAFAACLFHASNAPVLLRSKLLLGKVKARLEQLGIAIPQGGDLDLIFKKLNL